MGEKSITVSVGNMIVFRLMNGLLFTPAWLVYDCVYNASMGMEISQLGG